MITDFDKGDTLSLKRGSFLLPGLPRKGSSVSSLAIPLTPDSRPDSPTHQLPTSDKPSDTVNEDPNCKPPLPE